MKFTEKIKKTSILKGGSFSAYNQKLCNSYNSMFSDGK